MSSKTCSTKYPGLQIDEQLCLKLHRASNRFYGRYDRLLRSHGLTFSEYIVLVVVWERGPVSEGELARQLQFDPYTLEDTMLSLERRRLIQRHADPGRASYAMVVARRRASSCNPRLKPRGRSFSVIRAYPTQTGGPSAPCSTRCRPRWQGWSWITLTWPLRRTCHATEQRDSPRATRLLTSPTPCTVCIRALAAHPR